MLYNLKVLTAFNEKIINGHIPAFFLRQLLLLGFTLSCNTFTLFNPTERTYLAVLTKT